MVYIPSLVAALALTTSTVEAWNAPGYGGFHLVWQDAFLGNSGDSPYGPNWNFITGNPGVNGELETYSASNHNLQISGGQTVQLVPWRDGSVSGGWTSARMESKYVMTPTQGGVTRLEALIRFGGNDPNNKQGLWPAFWLLGDSIRHGTPWPHCGELDVLETIDGRLTGYGTAHCGVYPGGVCNEGTGIGGNIGIPDQNWHTWRIEIDRRPTDWHSETVNWFMDGQLFQSISGARINDPDAWYNLAESPKFFILNMAVGGQWPGYPNGNTQDGYGSMMEVAYVAHYST
ncbi:Uncharacterized protein TCAP_05060 [Tolypocladium capitatum]|uniref:GH16 domain-containing protein n=1 Tax=Tolypocladium capitatum TaxID=45235 RepID=A0A2K3QBR8_9HYPO|nr:Uncharacterized protein TCAP_05060 [Tolypocladium capitatum]